MTYGLFSVQGDWDTVPDAINSQQQAEFVTQGAHFS